MRIPCTTLMIMAATLAGWHTVDHALPAEADEPPSARRCGPTDEWLDVAAGLDVGPFDPAFVSRVSAATGSPHLRLEGHAIPDRPAHTQSVVGFCDALSGGAFGFIGGGLARIRFPAGVDDPAFGDDARIVVAPGRGFVPGLDPIVTRSGGRDSNPLLAVQVIGR